MRRRAAGLSVAVALFLNLDHIGATRVVAQATSQATSLQITATTESDLRSWNLYLGDRERTGEIRIRTSRDDPDRPGRTIERLDQFHNGLRIWGADVVRDSERGVPISIFGSLAPELTLSVRPTIAVDDAARLLRGSDGTQLLTSPELVVLPVPAGGFALGYGAVVAGDGVARVFVDAHTGRELWRYSEIQNQSAVGTGRGVRGDTKKLSVVQQQGTYVASDSHRPPVISTYDMRGNLVRTKLVLFGGALAAGDLARDADNDWSDPAVVDAHAHIAWTYDFFFKRFGRHGLDDRDRPIIALANMVSQQDALTLPLADLNFAINAAWCGACGPDGIGLMFFGNGIPSNFTFGGQLVTYLAGALDIVAHELTHAVTTSTSNLIPSNESGALNEAFSDMMGTSAEFFYRDLIPSSPAADYTIAEDVIRASRPGTLDGIRSLANPALFGNPDHYRNKYVGPSDNGGLHNNSTIPGHAFYLAIEGGVNRTSGQNVTGVGAANREQIEKAFYRAFTLLLPSNATFVTARAATTQAARDLYGAGSRAEQAVDQAWNAVGVPDPNSISSFTSTVAARSQVSFAFTMSSTGTYQVNMRGSDASLDLDMYLTPNTTACSRWPLPTTCVLTRSITPEAVESVKLPVRSGESYRIWIDNLGPRSSAFTLEQVVTP